MEDNYYEEVIQDIERRRNELGIIAGALRKLYNIPAADTAVVPTVPAVGATPNPMPVAASATIHLEQLKKDQFSMIKAVRKNGSGDPKTRKGKPCRLCLKNRPLDDYTKAKQCPDGHEGTCKECKKKKAKGYRAPASSDAEIRKEKACHKCGQVKPLSEYGLNKTCADGHGGTCKQCYREKYAAGHPQAPKKQESVDLNYPKACELCRSPCSTEGRYKHHMLMVHQKAVA